MLRMGVGECMGCQERESEGNEGRLLSGCREEVGKRWETLGDLLRTSRSRGCSVAPAPAMEKLINLQYKLPA